MASQPLYELIHAMTPGEKRYFQRKARGGKWRTGENYLELYEVLERSTDYDAEAIKAQLSNPVYAANLSFGKNYLYHQILDSLRDFHTGSNIKPQPQLAVADYWADLHLLIDKNLIKQAFKLIGQAKRHCRIFHLSLDRLKFLQVERNLISRHEKKDALKKLNKLIAECEELQQHLSVELQLVALYERMFLQVRAEKKELLEAAFTDFQVFLRHNQVYFSKKPSFTCRSFYHFTLGLGLERQQNFRLAKIHFAAVLELYDQDERVRSANLGRYISIFNNYFNNLLQGGDFEDEWEFLRMVGRLKDIKTEDPLMKASLEQHYLNFQLLFFVRSMQYSKAVQLDKPVSEMLARLGTKLIIDRKVTFYYHMGVAHFMESLHNQQERTQRLESAIQWLNEIDTLDKFETKALVRTLAKLFLILAHCELGAEDLVWYRIRSLMLALGEEKATKSVAYVLCDGIRKTLQAKSRDAKRVRLEALAEKLNAFPHIEEIQAWVASYLSRL